MSAPKEIQNPGSALGEAIGILIEVAVNRTLKPIAEANRCIYITAGPKNPKTNTDTKLLLRDSNGIEYNVDSVIANKQLQPLVLIESKYIRYKKHNRDKGSWVCTAHQSLRRRFSSVRSSVAVLAGSWSKTSKAMIKSADIALFEIPFDAVCNVLEKFGIDFRWTEKDRAKAYSAWEKFQALSDLQRKQIGEQLLNVVGRDLAHTISKVLDDTIPRTIKRVVVEVNTNLGEVKVYSFRSVEEALKFLKELDKEKILSTQISPTLLDDGPIQTLTSEEGDPDSEESTGSH